MYTDIINGLFVGTVLLEEFAAIILINAIGGMRLKHVLLLRKIVKYLILIEFTVFNFLFSFAHPEFVYQLVLQIVGNVIALLYFFFDIFYFSQKTRSYLFWLQNKVFKDTPLEDVFEPFSAEGVEYKEERKMPQQKYAIVNAGKDKGLCILVHTSNGGLLLKPIEAMDRDTLNFYAQNLEVDFESQGDFKYYKGSLPEEAIKEYDRGKEWKIYLWLRDKLFSNKGKTIMVLVGLGLFVVLILICYLLKYHFNYDVLDDWLSSRLQPSPQT